MYVVLKSDGQSNHHLIIIMMMMMMMMMIMVPVMVMVMIMIMIIMMIVIIIMTMIMIIIIIIIIIIILCLPSAVYIALMLVHPSKCLKQIIQKKLNRVKNPNWPEANQLAILQAWSTI